MFRGPSTAKTLPRPPCFQSARFPAEVKSIVWTCVHDCIANSLGVLVESCHQHEIMQTLAMDVVFSRSPLQGTGASE